MTAPWEERREKSRDEQVLDDLEEQLHAKERKA